jgi:hypothetical protein
MGDIEKLTPEEREFFATLPEHLGGIRMRKSLRIIEQQAVEIVRLSEELQYATNREVSLAEAANRAEKECVRLNEALEQRPTLPPPPSVRPPPPPPTVPAPPPGRYRLVRKEVDVQLSPSPDYRMAEADRA